MHPAWVTRLLHHAVLRRLIIDTHDTITDLSAPFRIPDHQPITTQRLNQLGNSARSVSLRSAARSFPSHLKAAVLAAARGRCVHPGCDSPIPWMHTDHIHPHSKHGPTHTTNAQILCSYHNHLKRDTPGTA